jgi:hypothetical protein
MFIYRSLQNGKQGLSRFFPVPDLTGRRLNTAWWKCSILEMVKEVALNDPDYVARVKQHYALFREKIDGRMNRQQRRRAGRKR